MPRYNSVSKTPQVNESKKRQVKEVLGYHEKISLPDVRKIVQKVPPISGTSLTNTGERITTIDLPRQGLMDGRFACVQFDLTLTAAANNCRLSKGHCGAIWDKVRVMIGNLTYELNKFSVLSVQCMKYEKPADWYAGLGSVIGYEASETNMHGTAYRMMLTFPDGFILNDLLPLGSMPQVRLELHLDSASNNYTTADDTKSDVTTVAVSNISFQAPILQIDTRGKSYSGGFIHYSHKLDSIASGVTSKDFQIPIGGGIISGLMAFIYADADVANYDNFNKIFSTKLAGTTRVEFYLNGEPLGSNRPIETDEAVEAVYHSMIYRDYPLNEVHNQGSKAFMLGSEAFTSEGAEDTAGDFHLAVNFGALGADKGVSGLINPNSTLEVRWTGNADENCTVHFYVRSHGSWFVDEQGRFSFMHGSSKISS